MVKLHENQRFKKKVRSIFDEDYTHEELVDELKEAMKGPFYTLDELRNKLKESNKERVNKNILKKNIA